MFSGCEGSLIRMSQICGMSTAAHQLYFCSLWCSHVKPLASYFKVYANVTWILSLLHGLMQSINLMVVSCVTPIIQCKNPKTLVFFLINCLYFAFCLLEVKKGLYLS